MKYIPLVLLIIIATLFSCTNSNVSKNFVLDGTIKGVTKGTVFLRKKLDTIFVAVDSFDIKKNGAFSLSDNIDSPEIYYLRLNEVPNDSILIFAEKGKIDLTTTLNRFSLDSKIKGSTNHDLLMEYKEMITKFNDARLDLFKANFEAEKAKNQQALDSINKLYRNHVKRRQLYSANFAVKHANKEVAPYIALTELYNANVSLLDTINNSLNASVKASNYGKQLDKFITFINKDLK